MLGDVSSSGTPDQAKGFDTQSSSYNQSNQPRRPSQNANSPPHLSPESPLVPPHKHSPNHPPSSQYGQRSGVFGQYSMSPQPAMGTLPSNLPYTYPHGYQSVPDNALIPQNIYGSYQSMLLPVQVYPYQRPQPMYSHQKNTYPSPPLSSSSSSSQNPSPPYPNHGQIRSLCYPSSISPSQYPHSFPYPHHSNYPSEFEGQGTWQYLPHATTNAPSYPRHYPMSYFPVHQEIDNTYTASSSTAAPAPSPNHPMTPAYPFFC
ncbi:hypothetical protein BT96DRAFT_441533 [Gymnopus androsaceus JB14]|uniref:Uncharacterized protein n=1 Tax=Gymnopus androsaceus JB14 TaxID=1447944 RepID=A0A6A4GS67_9AGAR|nr:hypothetical protein BT96DRAFT_441533 [Gymnopus androsaceus JB14]